MSLTSYVLDLPEEVNYCCLAIVGSRALRALICFFSQESGEPVGAVVNVFDSGGNDLLQVMLDSSLDILDATGKQKPAGTKVSEHLVWVPFVEAIVPIVDMKKREMHISPPKGLLELNLRYDERSKKERRQLVRHTLLVFSVDYIQMLLVPTSICIHCTLLEHFSAHWFLVFHFVGLF